VTSRGARVLVVGAGGLGAPALRLLACAPEIRVITVVDDDVVERSNLHRQTLFDEGDVGAPKVARAVVRLRALAEAALSGVEVRGVETRFVPDRALALLEGVTLVVEGADNFATKFLVADACARARIPVVQAGCVRWAGWAFASVPGESACLRCVFEDIPARLAARTGQVASPETCAEAGVVGPVVGVLGALEAVLALRLIAGDARAAGVLWRYDGQRGSVRRSRVRRRAGCPLCEGVVPSLSMDDYTAPACA
jgi:molybdopterin/thiamine biosynthesis adenylyltransferase